MYLLTDLVHTLTTALSLSLFPVANSQNGGHSDDASVSSGSRSPSQSRSSDTDIDLNLPLTSSPSSPSTSASSELSSLPATPTQTSQTLMAESKPTSQELYDESLFHQFAAADPGDFSVYLSNNTYPSQSISGAAPPHDIEHVKLHERVSSEPGPSALLSTTSMSISLSEDASSSEVISRGVVVASTFFDDAIPTSTTTTVTVTPRLRSSNNKSNPRRRWSTWAPSRWSTYKPDLEMETLGIELETRTIRG